MNAAHEGTSDNLLLIVLLGRDGLALVGLGLGLGVLSASGIVQD